MYYLWRAVDQEDEVLESYVTRKRDKAAALRFMRKALKRHGRAEAIVPCGNWATRPAARLADTPTTWPRIRLPARLDPQPLFPGTPPRRAPHLQASPLSRRGQVQNLMG
ncbi:DDE-type integrase/transposase/recombinase [Novosphingobium sp. KCTC 2891]|nr:DDE-type integrase/transposase/recombinase [Novosphingobium sp. KCTC 2891]